ncbi:toll/interleukin-1 receptor domain-containing protein [Streptomyces sp. MMCC 100]|uniref:toll/interleukin-1 receptor domain-containing protein n=1 Tax=Streptomyces sp. MMCC 100 TaxID=3163555 RepID=UPI003596F33A
MTGPAQSAARTDDDPRYDVFISYSQHLDREVATVFQRGMENFGRPWYRPVHLRVFRDMTHLSASPDLRGDIEDALARSGWLVVMASPLAAASPWVRAEIDWWVAHKGARRMLLAWTDGRLEWSPQAQDFDWPGTDALPREQMRRALAATPGAPRWVDLRWLRAQIDERGSVPANDPRLLADVAEFVAPITGRSKSELIGHHLRLRKRRNRLVAATFVALGALLATATGLGLAADHQRDVATERQRAATSRQLVAEATSLQYDRPDLARQLLVQAYRLSHTEQAVGALLGSAGIPRVLHTGGAARAVAFSPRGRLLAAASDGGVRLFDTLTGRAVSTLPGHREGARAVAFTADGGLLAVGDSAGRVRLWDMSDGNRPEPLGSARPVGDVHELSFAGTSPLLAVGNGLRVVLLDVRDPRRPEVTGHSTAFESALGFGADTSPDGGLVATGAGNDRVRIMGLSRSGRLSPLNTLDTPSSAVVFSPAGHLLATAGEDGNAALWDISDPRRPVRRTTLNGQNSWITPMAFTDDGRTLAVAAGHGAVQLWDVSDPGRPLQGDLLTGPTGPVDSLAFAPDGRTLASVALGNAGNPDEAQRATGSVRLWNVHGSRASSAYASLPSGQLSSQSFGPDGRTLVTGRPGALYQVGGAAEPRLLADLPSFNSGGQTYAFSPDGHTVATGHPLGLWDVTDPAHPSERGRFKETEDPQGVVYGPDGTVLAAAEPLGPVRLWEVSDPDRPRNLGTLPGSGAGPAVRLEAAPVAFAGDRGLLAVTGKDLKAVHVWDLGRTGHRYDPVRTDVIPLKAAARVTALTASPDGNTLYVGDSQGTLTVWDITDPRRARARGSAQRHAGEVTHLAADPVRPLLAGADDTGAVRLWDVADASAPREVALLATNERYATAGVAFSPDGGMIAVSAGDSTRLWRTDIGAVLGRLCAESGPITESQWKQYLPDRPYDPPCA